MAYYSDEATEKELAELENRIFDIYDKANAELTKTTAEYFANFKKRDEEMQRLVEDGEITKEKYNEWRIAQMGRGERWKKLRDDTARDMSSANQMAATMINKTTASVFELNGNYEAYVIEQYSDSVDFTLYDRTTVNRLIKDEPKLLPKSRIDIPKDEQWNRKRLESELISGIIQGKSVQDIAKSFQNVTGSNYKSALRNARTSVTGAQNGGRQARYDDAISKGVKIQKEWMATIDNRTRDSHAELDGVIVDADHNFPNGLAFPGDASGSPEEVYNCRCTMRRFMPEVMEQRESKIEGHDGIHTKDSYEAWKDEKIAAQKEYTSAGYSARAMESKE